jgi:hypothetical protein
LGSSFACFLTFLSHRQEQKQKGNGAQESLYPISNSEGYPSETSLAYYFCARLLRTPEKRPENSGPVQAHKKAVFPDSCRPKPYFREFFAIG